MLTVNANVIKALGLGFIVITFVLGLGTLVGILSKVFVPLMLIGIIGYILFVYIKALKGARVC